MEAGIYAKNEDTNPENKWGNDRFLPTNITFWRMAASIWPMGTAQFYIHKYDGDAKWVSKFGGPGAGKGVFNTPHGIWIDRRVKDTPKIVILRSGEQHAANF